MAPRAPSPMRLRYGRRHPRVGMVLLSCAENAGASVTSVWRNYVEMLRFKAHIPALVTDTVLQSALRDGGAEGDRTPDPRHCERRRSPAELQPRSVGAEDGQDGACVSSATVATVGCARLSRPVGSAPAGKARPTGRRRGNETTWMPSSG